MKISKGFKSSKPNGDGSWDSHEFNVTVDLEDLEYDLTVVDGDAAVKLRDAYAELSMQAEAICLIEKSKRGLIHPGQIREDLQPWAPTPPQN